MLVQRASLPRASQHAGYDDLTRYLAPVAPGPADKHLRRVLEKSLFDAETAPAPAAAAPEPYARVQRFSKVVAHRVQACLS